MVSGANRFLGYYVVARLLERGHSVRAIVRPASSDPTWNGNVEVFRRRPPRLCQSGTRIDNIDALLHLAAAITGDEDAQFAATVVGTEKLIEMMSKSVVRRLVHVSSFVAYDWSKAIFDERTPLLTDMYSMDGYTIARVWQERVVSRAAAAHSWNLTILRPGFIWGRAHAAIGGMGRIFGRVYLMFGPCTRLPLTHIVNCAHCVVAALECRLRLARNSM